MSRDNAINIAEPGKPVGGGTFVRVSWDKMTEALKVAGFVNEDETVDAAEIAQHGLTIRISKS